MKRLLICVMAMVAGVLGLTAEAKVQAPFSNVQPAPTVSPYLNLINNRGTGLPAYQTLVQPLLQQQQQQQQINQLQHTTQTLSAGGLTQPAKGASTAIRGTGHVTANMDYLHYYQKPQPRGLFNGKLTTANNIFIVFPLRLGESWGEGLMPSGSAL